MINRMRGALSAQYLGIQKTSTDQMTLACIGKHLLIEQLLLHLS